MKILERVAIAGMSIVCLVLCILVFELRGTWEAARVDAIVALSNGKLLATEVARMKKWDQQVAELHKREIERLKLDVRSVDMPWQASEDGKIEARLIHYKGTLRLQVRNASDEPLVVHEPRLAPWDLELTFDNERIEYVGAIPCTLPPRPVRLVPGEISEAEGQISATQFPGMPTVGMICLRVVYRSGDSSTEEIWQGRIELETCWQQ